MKLNFKLLFISSFFLLLFLSNYSTTNAAITITRPVSNMLGLVGYWTFDGKDTPNGVIRDVSGNGNHGNAISIATSTFYRPGKIGQGLNFDGVDDYVLTSYDMGTNTLTTCAWIYPTATTALGSIIGDVSYIMYLGASNTLRVTSNAATTIAVSADSAVTINKWNHACAVRNSNGTASLYVNSSISGTPDQANTIVGQAFSTAIGTRGSAAAFYFPGTIDDVRVYNRALSATEITQLYNQGR